MLNSQSFSFANACSLLREPIEICSCVPQGTIAFSDSAIDGGLSVITYTVDKDAYYSYLDKAFIVSNIAKTQTFSLPKKA